MSLDIVNYRPSWQRLRVSTLSVNNPYGGMTVAQGASDGIARMWNYINDSTANPQPKYVVGEINRMHSTSKIEYACRVYRVYNFLTATINGLSHVPTVTHIGILKQASAKLQPELDQSSVMQEAESWDWNVVQYEMETMWRQERYWFNAIYEDMRERVVDKKKSADNMFTFIEIMERVNRI